MNREGRRRTDQELRAEIDHALPFEDFQRQHEGSDAVRDGQHGPHQGSLRDRRTQLRLVPPSEWSWQGAQLDLVEGIMGRGMFALLYGASGSAKTLIGVDIGMHVANGLDWNGRSTKRGFVAYLAPEGGHSVHLRLLAWATHHDVELVDDVPFRTIPMRIDLCHKDEDVEAIIANIRAASEKLGPCHLIVVDTVSRALNGGDENGPRDTGNFVVRCDRLREATGATLLAVHHKAKEGILPRGHGSLMNAADVRLHAEKIAGGLFSLTIAHLKDGEAGDVLTFQLETKVVGADQDGEEVCGALVVPSDTQPTSEPGRPKAGKLNGRQLSLIQAIRSHCISTKLWKMSFTEFGNIAVRCGAVAADNPSKRQRIMDLRQQLAAKGLVAVDGHAETVTYVDPDLFANK